MLRRPYLSALSAVGLWSTLFLVGCASTAPPSQRIWSGRLAMTVHTLPPQRASAGFELQGRPEEGQLTLYSPLGTTLAHIRWSPEGAIWQRRGKWESRPTLGELTRELTGAELPVTDLFSWFSGQATTTEGWVVDLSGHADGRIQAHRQLPLPRVEMRLVFEP